MAETVRLFNWNFNQMRMPVETQYDEDSLD